MCILLAKPKGVILDPIVYRNCYNRNDHGVGIAYPEGGEVKILKGLWEVEEAVAQIQALEDKDLVIHFRLMSKGAINEANCHPFPIPAGSFPNMTFAVAHNGTLNWRSTVDKSDTSCFVDDALKPMLDRDPYFFDFTFNKRMMEHFIGFNNKLAIMRVDKEDDECKVYIINEKEGILYNGCWFSNLSFTDENSRFICNSDHKRIQHWKPKLWLEEPPKTVYGYGNEYSDMWPDGHGGMYGHNHTSPMKPLNQKPLKETYVPPTSQDWHFCPYGFGMYNSNIKYEGSRNLTQYSAWKEKNKDKIELIEGKYKPKDSFKDGTLICIPPKKEELDPMPYLSAAEEKIARRECLKIIGEVYKNFSPKGWSTLELAAKTRAMMRDSEDHLNGLSNKQLMMIIVTGDEECVFVNKPADELPQA